MSAVRRPIRRVSTERVAPEGRGGRFRMKRTPGGHLLRFWVPAGRRRRGAGRLVSILHPNPGCRCPNHRARRQRNPPARVEQGAPELIGHEEETRYTRRPGESKFAGQYYHRERGTRRRQYAIPEGATVQTEAGDYDVGGGIVTVEGPLREVNPRRGPRTRRRRYRIAS